MHTGKLKWLERLPNGSGVSREVPAPFCERPKGKFLRSTHHTALTKEMINLIFGSTIANQVENLTRIKEGKKISSAKMLESLWFQKKLEALFIKQIDRLHNMRTISFKSPPKIKEITLETVEVYIIIAIYLGLTDVEQELKQLCLQANIKSNLCQQFDYKFYSEEYFPLPFPI